MLATPPGEHGQPSMRTSAAVWHTIINYIRFCATNTPSASARALKNIKSLIFNLIPAHKEHMPNASNTLIYRPLRDFWRSYV